MVKGLKRMPLSNLINQTTTSIKASKDFIKKTHNILHRLGEDIRELRKLRKHTSRGGFSTRLVDREIKRLGNIVTATIDRKHKQRDEMIENLVLLEQLKNAN